MEINKKIAAIGTLFLGLAVILGAFGAHKFLFRPSQFKPLYTTGVFGGSFLLTKNMF
jgi:uncharacterized membrane protein YgdD (TMEM256/DUF423 family)